MNKNENFERITWEEFDNLEKNLRQVSPPLLIATEVKKTKIDEVINEICKKYVGNVVLVGHIYDHDQREGFNSVYFPVVVYRRINGA